MVTGGCYADGSADEEPAEPAKKKKAGKAGKKAVVPKVVVPNSRAAAKAAKEAALVVAAAATAAELELTSGDLLPAPPFSDLTIGMDVALLRSAYPGTAVVNSACVAWRSEVLRLVKKGKKNQVEICGQLFAYPTDVIVGVAQLEIDGAEESGEESDEESGEESSEDEDGEDGEDDAED